jgi:hypothetical protein
MALSLERQKSGKGGLGTKLSDYKENHHLWCLGCTDSVDIMFYGRRIFPKTHFSPSYFFSIGILAHGKTGRRWDYC